MHLAFALRGHKSWQDKFINELSTRYLEFNTYNPQTQKLERKLLESRLCPITLWDYVFPEEHFDAVANTILTGHMKGKPLQSKHQKFVWALRKAMGFKKIPDFKVDKSLSMLPPQHQEIIGIGVKEDLWLEPDGRQVQKKDKSDLAYEGI